MRRFGQFPLLALYYLGLLVVSSSKNFGLGSAFFYSVKGKKDYLNSSLCFLMERIFPFLFLLKIGLELYTFCVVQIAYGCKCLN